MSSRKCPQLREQIALRHEVVEGGLGDHALGEVDEPVRSVGECCGAKVIDRQWLVGGHGGRHRGLCRGQQLLGSETQRRQGHGGTLDVDSEFGEDRIPESGAIGGPDAGRMADDRHGG